MLAEFERSSSGVAPKTRTIKLSNIENSNETQNISSVSLKAIFASYFSVFIQNDENVTKFDKQQ